jgi:WD40 repeat protein
MLTGHGAPIVDFEFSPFNDQLLSTASEDATIKLWVLPEDGLASNVKDCDGELIGHSKKLIISRFHPSAENTIASTAADVTVRIWDLEN